MRPSDLKSLRSLLAIIREELASLRKVIEESATAVTNQSIEKQKANQKEWEETQKILSRPHHTDENEQAATEANQQRRHWQNFGLQGVLVLGTWLAFVAAAIYAGIAARQLSKMSDTYREMRSQTYMECLNAQAAQQSLIQVQRNAADSHVATVGVLKQAGAAVEAERAIVSFRYRIPTRNDSLAGHLVIYYFVKNEGKSQAADFTANFKAVLLGENDALTISEKDLEPLHLVYIPGGTEFPPKADDPNVKVVSVATPVWDTNEKQVPIGSQEVADFFNGRGKEVEIYGRYQYSDIAGPHKVRFCFPIFFMAAGTTSKTTRSEVTCAKYNHEENQDTVAPQIDALPTISRLQVKSIDCVKPGD
jgi:hypothetical protein